MDSKSILQTIGTVTSIILGIISIEIFKYTKNLEEHISVWSLADFFVMMFTFYIMIRTGISFLKSRKEYEGINYFLNICLAILHFASIPAIFITVLVIDFGKNWLVVLIVSIIFVAWAKRNRNLQNRTVRTVE